MYGSASLLELFWNCSTNTICRKRLTILLCAFLRERYIYIWIKYGGKKLNREAGEQFLEDIADDMDAVMRGK